MSKMITVTLNGQAVTAKAGTPILNLLDGRPTPSGRPPLGALVNHRLMGLYRPLRSDCQVETIDYSSKEGANIYRRTVVLMLGEAFTELHPQARLEIGQALGAGYFFNVYGAPGPVTGEMLAAVERRMGEIAAENRSIYPTLVSTEEAEAYFTETGYPFKVLMLRQRLLAEVPWVVMNKFRDLSYGPVAPNTGMCREFALIPYSTGFVLNFPDSTGRVSRTLTPQPKLFAAYQETREWNERLGVWNIAQLNQACIDGSISEIIKVSEGLQEKKIARCADEIKSRIDQVRLVLIAGPSSSGKTTFTKRLAVQLRVNGIRPIMISLDNYYVARADTPKNPDGTYNFECLEALDVPLFNRHLEALMEGREAQTPVYDFVRGDRRPDKTLPLTLASDQVLIAEGIHGLNPRLTAAVANENKFKIYVSAMTQLCIDDHNRIFTSDGRLLRRIVRDKLFRGYSASQTIQQWPHVREGENAYIFPFQEEAGIFFDTSLVYEAAVLHPYARRFLMEVDQQDPAYIEAYRLFMHLGLFMPIFSREVPPTSILREFIGGSTFTY